MTARELIEDYGTKTPGKCSTCGKACLYLIDDGQPVRYSPFAGPTDSAINDSRAKMCSWCDLSADDRYE